MSLYSLVGSNAATGVVCACDVSSIPGLKTRLRLVPKCEVDTFPALLSDTAVTSMSDYVTLDGDIVLDATVTGNGYWREYDIIQESGNITDNLVGERGSKSFDSDLIFRLAGVDAEQKGFAKLIANGCFIASVQNKNGQWEVLGNPDNPAQVDSIALSRGATSTDTNEGAYVIRANTGLPAYDYNGTFDLTPTP